MSKLHADEVDIADDVVRALVDTQHPEWSGRPLVRLPPVGTDNQLFRLGDDLLVRMPRTPGVAPTAGWDHTWLPRLAPHLPLPVPVPLALGQPGYGYPFPWTVVPWVDGDNPTLDTVDAEHWGEALGSFVRTLRAVDPMGAPVKDEGRGAPLGSLDGWVRTWTDRADPSQVDRRAVLAVWERALAAPAWSGEPAWFHGDLHEGNVLAREGRVVAVIDWGTAGRGDPAVELNALWGYLPEPARAAFDDAAALDEAAHERARGFALAPAISASTYYRETDPVTASESLETVRTLVATL